MSRVIARDNIQQTNETRKIEDTLFDGQIVRPSALEREGKAYNQPVYKSNQSIMAKDRIGGRGLLNSVSTSQGIFVPPMITNQAELVSRYTRPRSGLASNPRLNQERVDVGKYIMSNSQAVWSGRLY